MEQRIIAFHQDDEQQWVAQLACGHNQHVRHNAPWTNRPWVTTPEGRDSMIDRALNCAKCDTAAPPDRPSTMKDNSTPEAIVQRQLDAYNAKNLEAWLATYADDARQFEHPGTLLAAGHEEIRARAVPRFQETNLHAKLLQRSVMGHIVIDHETVNRTFSEGPGRMELVCIYEVREGKIQTASFVFGEKSLDASA